MKHEEKMIDMRPDPIEEGIEFDMPMPVFLVIVIATIFGFIGIGYLLGKYGV